MVWIIGFFTLTGYNFSFWLLVSLVRLLSEKFSSYREKHIVRQKYNVNDVAAIIPAHNEERTINRTLNALLQVLPKKNIYVASDYSTDKTIQIARSFGVRMLDIRPNKGKARSLVWILSEYKLLDAYKFIIINDADTLMDKNYLALALPYFNDHHVACVATHGVSRLKNYNILERFFIAYRIRLWRIIQYGMRYGQTWKYINASFIVPGSLSLYRSSVLKKLEIDAPGLIIEDFNMTFEVHKKKLGKIVYTPKFVGIHQDPYNLMDYIKQVQRWNVGFFQTVKRHGIWPSFFWLSTTLYYLELLMYALFIGFVPFLIFFITFNNKPITVPFIMNELKISDIFIGVFFMDYVTTVIAAFFEKKWELLFYGLGFIFLRYIDALIYIGSFVLAFTTKYSGRWESPKRL